MTVNQFLIADSFSGCKLCACLSWVSMCMSTFMAFVCLPVRTEVCKSCGMRGSGRKTAAMLLHLLNEILTIEKCPHYCAHWPSINPRFIIIKKVYFVSILVVFISGGFVKYAFVTATLQSCFCPAMAYPCTFTMKKGNFLSEEDLRLHWNE